MMDKVVTDSLKEETNSDDKYLLQSVDKALCIIDLLGQNDELSVTQISKFLRISKSSVFRLISTLEKRGFVKKDFYSRCRLGMKFSYLGDRVLSRLEIVKAAHPFLEELAAQANETCHLSIWDDDWKIRFIDKVKSPGAISMSSFVGSVKNCYSTASGKALLAYKTAEEYQRFSQEITLVSLTQYTITDLSVLSNEMDHIRKQGYVVSMDEDEYGLSCVGAPIFDQGGNAVAAVSVSGPTGRMLLPSRRLPEYVMAAAKRISSNIT